MSEYITTHARLKQVALQMLGEMKAGTTYAKYMTQARVIAARHSVSSPMLLLAMKYKPERNTAQVAVVTTKGTIDASYERDSTEVVYPISQEEWEIFIADTPVYLMENPTIWVVDGSKYTAPI